MTPQRRKRLTAWLGVIAMWLVVCMPLASQLVAAAQLRGNFDAPLCSAVRSADGDHRGTSSVALAACGYCDLLATHTPAPPVAPVSSTLVLLVAFAAAPVLSTSFTPLGAFPSGRPRAPPAFS